MSQVTSITISNLGPGLKAIKDHLNANITMRPGDSRTVKVNPHHAKMLLTESIRPGARIRVEIDDEERAKMEQSVAADRRATGPIPNGATVADAPVSEEANRARAALNAAKPGKKNAAPKTERRFITDPKPTEDDEPSRKRKKASAKKKAKSARELRRERRERRRQEEEDDDE